MSESLFLPAPSAGVSGALGAIFIRPIRAIGFIIPDVIIEESHSDALTLTDHPVEFGAPITDHAFRQQYELTIRCGWDKRGDEFRPIEIYGALKQLQESRQPFTVYTGKRTYVNMLMPSLQIITNAETENALIVQVGLREVILVSTQTATLPDKTNQSEPERTGDVTNTGPKSLASQSTAKNTQLASKTSYLTGSTGTVVGGV